MQTLYDAFPDERQGRGLPARLRFLAAACLVIAMAPGGLQGREGEEPRYHWWRVASVQKELRLTASQVEALDEIFEHKLAERVALHHEIEAMERLLERTLERGDADEKSVAALSEQLETLRAKQNIRRTLMLLAMYRTLTPEQREAFTDIRRAMKSAPPPDREPSRARD